MSKLVALVKKLAAKELSNPVVSKTVHTAWQAALGAAVAAASGTHGDAKTVVLVGVAAAAAAVKNAVFGAVHVPPAVDPATSQPAPATPPAAS